MNEIMNVLRDYVCGNISKKNLRLQLNNQRKEFEKDFSIDKIANEVLSRKILSNDSDDFNEVVKKAIDDVSKPIDIIHYVSIRLPYRYNEVLETVSQLVVKKRELENNTEEQESFAKEYYLCREAIFNSFNCLEVPKTIYDMIYNNIIVLAESMTDTGGFCMNSINIHDDNWCMKKLERLLEIYKGEDICLLGYMYSNGMTEVSIVL